MLVRLNARRLWSISDNFRETAARSFSAEQVTMFGDFLRIVAPNKNQMRTTSIFAKTIASFNICGLYALTAQDKINVNLLAEDSSSLIAFGLSPMHTFIDGCLSMAQRDIGLILRLRRLPKKVRKNMRGRVRSKTSVELIGPSESFAYSVRFARSLALVDLIEQKIILDLTSLQCRINIEAITNCISVGLDSRHGVARFSQVQIEM